MVPSLDLTVCALAALKADERSAIVGLCAAVFDEDFSTLFDNPPATVTDLRATHQGQLIGHACWWSRRFQPRGAPELDTAYLKLVAVAPRWQGQGIGSLLLRRFADETTGQQLRALSTSRPAFYERLGWQRWRGRIAIRTPGGLLDTPDDTVMILPTRFTPPLDLDRPLTAEPRDGTLW